MQKFIPLSVPNFGGNEKKYTEEAVVSEWVSTGGGKVSDFEIKFGEYVSKDSSVATASGTAALHLALICLGLSADEEVLVPTLTFVAAVNPVRYVGAYPVFFDCDDTLCIDAEKVRLFCENNCDFDGEILINRKSKRRVKGIIPVHVFGNIANMESLTKTAEKYKLFVLEDATEAVGSRFLSGEFAGMTAGTVGDMGAYSFNGNKLITTGSGGALVGRCEKRLTRAKYLSTQAKDDEIQFVHGEIGYNYRMTNVQAALGLAQLEQVEDFIATKHRNYEYYKELLEDVAGVRVLPFRDDIRSNKWFYCLYLENFTFTRDELIDFFAKNKIGARPIWTLIHTLKPYEGFEYTGGETSALYREKVVNLPCSTNVTKEDVEYVCEVIRKASLGGK